MRYLWIALCIPVLAACGGQPESVIPPTAAEVIAATEPPSVPTEPPAPPVQEVFPTALPQREAAPEPEITIQVVAVAEPGSLDAPDNVVAGELYAFEANSNTFRRLTVTQGNVSDPVWSPDGLRVYYTSDETGTSQIFVLTATNTSPVSQLSPFDVGDQRQPTVSPDNRQLAFTSARGGADAIYLMNAIDGRQVRQITFNPTPDYDPAWSPDNTWIAFTSERDGNPEIYIMDTDGGQVQRLTDHPANDSQPAFSPDGRQLAFISDRDGTPQIHVMGLPVPTADPNDVSEAVAVDILNGVPSLVLDPAAPPPDAFQITSGDTPKASPSWFEDELGGFGIVYTDQLNGPSDIPLVQVYRMGSDGSNIRPLTQPFISLSSPAVRPGTPQLQVTPAPTVIFPTSTPIIQPTEVDPLDLTVTPE